MTEIVLQMVAVVLEGVEPFVLDLPRFPGGTAAAVVGGATGTAVAGGKQKAASKRIADDLPVPSLISELGTLTANTVRMADSKATFTMHSEPTALLRGLGHFWLALGII